MATANVFMRVQGAPDLPQITINGGWGQIGVNFPSSAQVVQSSPTRVTFNLPASHANYVPVSMTWSRTATGSQTDVTSSLSFTESSRLVITQVPVTQNTTVGGNGYYTINIAPKSSNDVRFTETLASGITSNTGGSSNNFPKGVTNFKLDIASTFNMFETDGRENEVKLVQGSTTYYKTVKPYQNTIEFTADIQEDFSLVAGIKTKPLGKLTTHLTRCSSDWDNVRENFPYGVWSITFTADENTVFQVNGKLIMTDPTTNEIIYEDTIRPTNATQFTYTLDNDLGGFAGNVEVFMMATSTIVQASSFLRVYNVTDEEMTQVAQDRYITGMNDGHLEILVDKGKNIVRIMNIPFEIPEDMLTPSTIKLGVYNTGIMSNELSDYRISFDIGTISVPHKFNNVLDFVNTELELYLPYTDPIILEPNYVIGRDIRVEYLMNMYNGDVDINVYSSLIPEIPFITKSTNISMNIPFLPTEIYGIEQRNNLAELTNNNITKAQIHVKRNVPVINEFGIPVNATDTLDKFTGYSEITNIKLNSRADRAEQAEIKSLLARGVVLP